MFHFSTKEKKIHHLFSNFMKLNYFTYNETKSELSSHIPTWLVDRVLPEVAVASNQSPALQVSLVSCRYLWQLIISLAWHQNLLSRYPDKWIDNNNESVYEIKTNTNCTKLILNCNLLSLTTADSTAQMQTIQ